MILLLWLQLNDNSALKAGDELSFFRERRLNGDVENTHRACTRATAQTFAIAFLVVKVVGPIFKRCELDQPHGIV